jgi:hypothetical protein
VDMTELEKFINIGDDIKKALLVSLVFLIISLVIIALIYLTDFFNGYELIILFSIPILFKNHNYVHFFKK